MIQHVLSIACTVTQLTEQLDKFRMQVVNACLYHSTLALLLDCSFNLSSSFGDGFLYSRRMNASVKYQLFKGHTRDFAPYRVKA